MLHAAALLAPPGDLADALGYLHLTRLRCKLFLLRDVGGEEDSLRPDDLIRLGRVCLQEGLGGVRRHRPEGRGSGVWKRGGGGRGKPASAVCVVPNARQGNPPGVDHLQQTLT